MPDLSAEKHTNEKAQNEQKMKKNVGFIPTWILSSLKSIARFRPNPPGTRWGRANDPLHIP